jgi:hypothetical protein
MKPAANSDAIRTDKYDAARNSPPEELKGILDEMVEHYRFSSTITLGRSFASYAVLAEMAASDGDLPLIRLLKR